ncbi:MAG: hypothetical protein ACYC67_00700 [Prosthecobacter sp.]
MKVSISMDLCASLAAYLRQAQLSLHRADSMAQLADFFHSWSVPPTVVSGALCREVPDFIRSAPVDWPALFERADSEIHRALSKLRSVFGSKSKASVRMDELSSALVALESLADLLSGRALLSQSEISDVRLKLCYCSELLLLRMRDSQVVAQIHSVDHLNSAEHLVTVPIQSLPGWQRVMQPAAQS